MPKYPRRSMAKRFLESQLRLRESREKIRNAVHEVISRNMTIRQAADQYKVSKSALHRKITKYKSLEDEDKERFNFSREHGFKCVFTTEEETLLKQYLIEAAQMCYGLTLKSTRELAYRFAIANGKNVPQSWEKNKMAGVEWAHCFRKRNPDLALRTPEATSLSRATSFNKHNVGQFFTNLREVLGKFNFQPTQIFNCDETGITTVHRPPKILASSAQRQVGKVTRKNTRKGRKKAQSTILTDTPVKKKIEEEHRIRLLKQTKKLQPNKVKKKVFEESSDSEDVNE